MIHWLGSLNPILLFTLFGIVGIAITVLLDVVMRRRVEPTTRERANSTASVTLTVIATIYAILIAFVIVDAYTQIRSTQDEISTKAASLSIVVENSRALPSAKARPIQEGALAYARSVINNGIPHLEDTNLPDRTGGEKLEALFRSVRSVNPVSTGDRAAYTAMLDALDDVVRAREQLITSSSATIPGPLLALLFVIGICVMAVAALLDTRHRRSHLFILSTLALVIWLTLALVVSLDYPFSGTFRVTDQPLREFVDVRAAR